MDEKIDLSKKISERIKDGKVKMRPRWFFVAEKLGLESVLLISVILGIIILAVILYIMDQNGVFEFAEFGWKGWLVILNNIPFNLIITAIIFFLVSLVIISQFDVSYQKPFYLFSCSVLLIMAMLGFGLFWSGVGEAMFNSSVSAKMATVYQNKIVNSPKSDRAVIGKIIKIGDQTFFIVTPQNKVIQVRYGLNHTPLVFNEGQTIKIIGRRDGENFKAESIKIIRKNINRFFKPTPVATMSN